MGGASKKTVLVYIHGGGFATGDSRNLTYGVDFLVSQDNIVVKIQYRLGVFGFMNFGTDEYTGNMGLKDQQMALKWVHDNIENFSGNKNEVLLFGQSAGKRGNISSLETIVNSKYLVYFLGGASVHFQMLNPQSRSYFQRAFASSGAALIFSVVRKTNHVKLLQECTGIYDIEVLKDYLTLADADLLRTCSPFNSKLGAILTPWVPSVERESINGAFLTKTPEDIYNSNEAPVMDTMFTFNAQVIIVFKFISTVTLS